MEQTLMDKLTILADSAKYDVACTSSGASRTARAGILGSCYAPGCCHAFTADGRCVSLLKVLMTNCCAFDCSYCVNRKSNDIPRATFTPRELAELTVEFYRRNYIEGLFLSSAVLGTPDYTTERMLAALRLLRGEYRFGGYIHAKAIPGTSPELLQQLGYLADRLSVNVELPSEQSLNLLAPDKGRHSIFRPMKQIAVSGAQSKQELTVYRHAPRFAPAGQSTQMIVGASPETDYHILKLTEGMYQKYSLKRVFYSAYIPVAEDTRLPALDTKPPLLREHRLYQADWLLRFYQFKADEILDEANQIKTHRKRGGTHRGDGRLRGDDRRGKTGQPLCQAALLRAGYVLPALCGGVLRRGDRVQRAAYRAAAGESPARNQAGSEG